MNSVILTADDDTEQDTDHEVPNSHGDHDTYDRDILHPMLVSRHGSFVRDHVLAPADTVACVPKCLFHKIDAKHNNERTYDDDRWYTSIRQTLSRNSKTYGYRQLALIPLSRGESW